MEYGPIIDTIVWYSAYDVGKSFLCLRQELLTFVRDFLPVAVYRYNYDLNYVHRNFF